ncbi:MFS transporter [Clostridium sp. C8]|uniref:MFS transporter n=1 Tax=Clostridium sp. C8 TaxID=1667357 RepID=UPI00062E3AE9|nr:MFS transporter [Clostridium sp. C8]KLE16629.1 multidrug MFS transporter [Clostridium sp. C8]
MKMKKEWAILLTVLPMTFMTTLDSSIVNVALPTMSRELGTTMAGIEWVVTSYLITICATILLFGRLGDIVGKSKVFKIGIGVFTLGSLFCGLSNSLIMLILSRIIQAIGAGAAMATNQGIITETFPPTKRGRALGMTGTAVALGTMVGPTLGGLIVSVAPWEYIFLINIPIGILVYIGVLKVLNFKKITEKVPFDIKGTFLFMISIIMLFTSINFGQSIGYTNPIIMGAFVLSLVLLFIFIKVEQKIISPMLDINIFKNKLFSLSIFCGFTSFVSIGAINIILPFYYQDVLKLTPSSAGFMMTVSPIILSIVAPISGHLSDKLGSEKISCIGLSILTIGIFSLTIFNQYTSLIIVAIFVGLVSLGSGIFQSPNNSLIMSTVDKTKLGIAGSVNGLVRNLGTTTGIALSTSILYSRMSSKIGYKVSGYVEGRADIFIYAMRFVFAGIGCICLIGAILTLLRVVNKRSKTLN